MRWSFEALRTSEQLWYGAMALSGMDHALSDEQAERLVTVAASDGRAWPSAAAEHDCSEVAKTAEQELLKRGGEAFEAHVRKVRAQNDDLADAQLRSLEAHLTHQRDKHEQLRARFLERGNLGLAQVQVGNIERLTARVQRERLRITQRRQLRASFDDVSVGIVRVE
jgi:hypothetical protein